ncbi:MAG: thiamine pyrophosphate-binding protein [Sulfolobales archaeon]|nr:thiamine pyrophosphate-binding protein [Sulfolobales archaeon]MCX8186045.1 thiamine pyrophosphate-binding protein [Sulfolobales archaeon]MDW7969340.1 thiamine pyrophosphate-binding protein [Sulfolobales archaeon]
MKVSELLVDILNKEDVEYYFTVFAEHTLGLSISIEKAGKPKSINAAYEPGVGFMGISYSRVSGKVGVSVLTGGPGVLGAVNPIAMAHVEGDPLVVIATTPPRSIAYKNCLHAFPNESDQLNVFRTVTKRQFKITAPNQIPDVISKAFNTAVSGRPGPVYLEMPADIFDENIDSYHYLRLPASRPTPNEDVINEVLRMLRSSKKPVILAGRGVTISGAESELIAFAEYFDIPVCTTVMGKGVIHPSHPLYAGVAAGNLGDLVAEELLSNADLVLALGVRFSQMGTGRYSMKISGNLIHVNISSDEFGRVFKPTLAVEADVKEFLNKILLKSKNECVGKISRGSSEVLSNLWATAKKSHPSEPIPSSELIESWEVVKLIRDTFDEDTIFTCDVGAHRIETFTMPIYKPRTYVITTSYVSMGMGVPSAIGAKLARRDAKVVGLVGDGGFLMTGLEVVTGVRYNLPVIIFVFNDSSYRVVRIYERASYGTDLTHKLPSVNYCELAKSLGAHGIRIEKRDELKEGVDKALSLAKDRPVVVDVVIDPNSVPLPMRRLYKASRISEISKR